MRGIRLNLQGAALTTACIAVLGGSTRLSAHGLVFDSPAAQATNEVYQAAQSDITKGNYSAAAEKFRQMLKLDPSSPEVWSDLGVAYSMEGQHQEAVEAFQKALQLNPSLRSANLMLGIDLVRLGKPEGAIPHLELVLKQRPTDGDALSALASALFATHQFEKAADIFRRESQLDGKAANAWYGMGICFEHVAEDAARKLGEIEIGSAYYHELVGEFLTQEDTGNTQQAAAIDAEKELRSALERSGHAAEGFHAALGFALLKAGDVSRASEEFETELRVYPGSLDGKLGLVEVAVAKRDFAAAVPSVCAIDETDAGYYESHLTALVESLETNGESGFAGYLAGAAVPASCSAAIEELKVALSAASPTAGLDRAFEAPPPVAKGTGAGENSRRGQGRAEFEAGHYTACAQTLAGGSSLNASDESTLARCAFLSGHFLVAYDAAEGLQAGGLASAPTSVPGTYWKAEAAKKLSQSAFQKAVLTSPDSWQGHVLMGDIYRQQSKWDLAISEYTAAAKLMPTSPAADLGLGTVYWQNGQNGPAESALRTALQIDPENPQANFELGDVLVREHHFEDATLYLERTVKQRPDFLAAHADLAKVYIASDKTARAIAEVLKALPADNSGDLHYQLYLLYKKQGMTRQAQTALEQSQKLRAATLKTRQENLEEALHLSKETDGSGQP
jgi:tetratricopeptide (TPR) repeat protein